MLEEVYGKMAIKKMRIYEWHKCFHIDRVCISSLINVFQKGILKTKKCTFKSPITRWMHGEGYIRKNGQETAGFFCITTHMHISHQ
jgi:hypothetical protein